MTNQEPTFAELEASPVLKAQFIARYGPQAWEVLANKSGNLAKGTCDDGGPAGPCIAANRGRPGGIDLEGKTLADEFAGQVKVSEDVWPTSCGQTQQFCESVGIRYSIKPDGYEGWLAMLAEIEAYIRYAKADALIAEKRRREQR